MDRLAYLIIRIAEVGLLLRGNPDLKKVRQDMLRAEHILKQAEYPTWLDCLHRASMLVSDCASAVIQHECQNVLKTAHWYSLCSLNCMMLSEWLKAISGERAV